MERCYSKEACRDKCNVKGECPLNGVYLVRDIAYKAKPISGVETK